MRACVRAPVELLRQRVLTSLILHREKTVDLLPCLEPVHMYMRILQRKNGMIMITIMIATPTTTWINRSSTSFHEFHLAMWNLVRGNSSLSCQ
jgi:hypothetical protein